MFFSATFKQTARSALKNHWQTGLLIVLVVNLPTLLVQAIATFTGNDLLENAQLLVITAARDGALSSSELSAKLLELIRQPAILTMQGLALLAWLITPCLALGMDRWVLLRLRGQEAGFSTVFSLIRYALKSIGLRLFLTLKIFLWMLPGLGLTLLSMLFLGNGQEAASGFALFASSGFLYGGTILMVVLGMMAYLRYAMADFLLADDPASRIRDCVRRSRGLMKDKKAALFSLELSFLLWYLAELLVASFLAGMGSGILSLMFQMLAGLALSLYLRTSVGAFYDAYTKVYREGTVPFPEK